MISVMEVETLLLFFCTDRDEKSLLPVKNRHLENKKKDSSARDYAHVSTITDAKSLYRRQGSWGVLIRIGLGDPYLVCLQYSIRTTRLQVAS